MESSWCSYVRYSRSSATPRTSLPFCVLRYAFSVSSVPLLLRLPLAGVGGAKGVAAAAASTGPGRAGAWWPRWWCCPAGKSVNGGKRTDPRGGNHLRTLPPGPFEMVPPPPPGAPPAGGAVQCNTRNADRARRPSMLTLSAMHSRCLGPGPLGCRARRAGDGLARERNNRGPGPCICH